MWSNEYTNIIIAAQLIPIVLLATKVLIPATTYSSKKVNAVFSKLKLIGYRRMEAYVRRKKKAVYDNSPSIHFAVSFALNQIEIYNLMIF